MQSFLLLWILALIPPGPDVCSGPPEYYKIELLPTRRVPAARQAKGVAHVTFVDSPFGLAVSRTGQYRYNLDINISRLGPVPGHTYIVWLSTPDLKNVHRLGPLLRDGEITGQVDWNKFIVFVTLESLDAPVDAKWQGPVVLRGLSRSGLMHTMAGHGPYEQEPCTVYGYY